MTKINEKKWVQPHSEHKLKGIKGDRDPLLPWYLKIELIWHQVENWMQKSFELWIREKPRERETELHLLLRSDGGPVRVWKDKFLCQPTHSSILFLVRLLTRRRSTAVSETGFRMCSTIYPGEFKISNYCHLYYRQDLLLLLPYKPEYNSIFEVHVSILALQFLELLTVLSNAWNVRNISQLFKILLENSYVTDLLVFFMHPLSSIYYGCCFHL